MKPLPLLSLLLLTLVAGCARPAGPTVVAASEPALAVNLATAALVTAPSLIEVTGTVRPAQRATLAARVMGVVATLDIALGQTVPPGEVLVRLDAGEIAARLAQAHAEANLVHRDLARERHLLTQNASTAETVRTLEDRAAQAAARTLEAETLLGYTELRAPFAAVVVRKFADAGDLATPGQPLLELEGVGAREIEAGIPDSLAAGLAPGQDLIAADGAHTFAARLLERSAAAERSTRTVTVRLAVPAGEALRSGQFVRVRVPGPADAALLVPATAVTRSGQMERVFVAGAGQRAELRLVRTGVRHGDQVEILSGLDAGERVVVAPPAALRDGRLLQPRP